MLLMVVRKLGRNRWLVSSLLAGITIAVALVASIPLYTAGILQRMLTRDLEIFQERQSYFAGRYTIYGSSRFVRGDGSFAALNREIDRRISRDLGLPVLARTRLLTVSALEATPEPARAGSERRFLELGALSEAADHLKIQQGRLFSDRPVDGVLEVVANPQAMARKDLRLGETYEVRDTRRIVTAPLLVRVVGVYDVGDPTDLWWFQSIANYDDTLLADFDLLSGLLEEVGGLRADNLMWSFALDYHAISLANLRHTAGLLEGQVRLIEAAGLAYDSHMLPILRAYLERERTLRSTLWFLHVPVLVTLAFYVYMVSLLIVDSERTEIALLKSRGASATQIVLVYLLESALLAGVALLLGPPLGLLFCSVMGASNGFLELVGRAPLPTRLSLAAYLYAAGSALLLALTMLVPAALAARTTIVIHKQRRARAIPGAAWKRSGADAILLAVSAAGYYAYRFRRHALTLSPGADLPLDPLLFLVSAAFLLGCGLLFLRLHPLLVRAVFRAGRRVWPAGLYTATLNVGRSGGSEQFIMLFLILTLSVGILNARSARTINRNVEETIAYAAGADIVLMEDWPSSRASPSAAGPLAPGVPSAAPNPGELLYQEPDFQKYRSLGGVALATRVFRTTQASGLTPEGLTMKVSLMGIVPQEFAEVAWFRPTLLPRHWHVYCNLLAASPNALLVSENAAAEYGVRVGDTINVNWAGQDYLDGIVRALVPYWPTFNPYDDPADPVLVVANLSYVQAKMATEPYEVWLKKAPGATSAQLYDSLGARRIDIVRLEDAAPKLLAARNDPLLQGTNGALSMGFVVTMVACLMGFLIYWILAMESRQLQYGLYRAMGLSKRSILGMVAWEQLLVTLLAVLAGIVIGGVAADLFVPLLELTRSAPSVPPFAVTASAADYGRIYGMVGLMLAVGLCVVGARIAHIRAPQAIKLGED